MFKEISDDHVRIEPDGGRIKIPDNRYYNMLCSWKNWSLPSDHRYKFQVRVLFNMDHTTAQDGWKEIILDDRSLDVMLRKRQYMVNVELDWGEGCVTVFKMRLSVVSFASG